MKSKAYWVDKRLKARTELHAVTERLGQPVNLKLRPSIKLSPPKDMKRRRQRKRPHVLKELKRWKRILRNERDQIQTRNNLEKRRAALILRLAYIEERIKTIPTPTKWDLLDEDPFNSGVRGT